MSTIHIPVYIPSPFTPGNVVVRMTREQKERLGIKGGRKLSPEERAQVEQTLEAEQIRVESYERAVKCLAGLAISIEEYDCE